MSIAYLNGDFLPLEDARISPLDRGFLFGDAVYEVIPSYDGKLVGFEPHINRLHQGLDALNIQNTPPPGEWRTVCESLLQRNGGGNRAVYLHISRGADTTRSHVCPENIPATLFAFSYEIAPQMSADPEQARTLKVNSQTDLRWRRCHIKSTSLLGSVMHLQQGVNSGNDEVLLVNENQEITEGASCNVFVVKDGSVATPPLEQQILPGITRHIALEILGRYSTIPTEVRRITLKEAQAADEIWFSSSTRDLIPVVEMDGQAIGTGTPGPIWAQAQTLFREHKFSY